MNGVEKVLERILRWILRILSGLLALVSFALFGFGLFVTISFRQLEENDYPDMILLNPALMFALFLVAGILILKAVSLWRGGEKAPVITAAVAAFVISVLFIVTVRGLPTCDALLIEDIVKEFYRGSYGALRQGGYISTYPFQLSWCFIVDIASYVAGFGNYVPYWIANALSIVISTLAICGLADEFFETDRKRVLSVRSCAVLTSLCFWLFVYSTHIYNDIVSLAPLFAGLYMTAAFLKRRNPAVGLPGALLLGVSWWIKSNGLIALIAAFMCVAGCLFSDTRPHKRKKMKKYMIRVISAVGALILIIAVPVGLRVATYSHFERLSGVNVPGGVPATAYIAMGLTENDGKMGWYNGDNTRYYHDNGDDPSLASAAAMPVVLEKLSIYTSDIKSFAHFFGMKFLSQWADPTRVSLREQELTSRHRERAVILKELKFMDPIADFWIYGGGYSFLGWEMRVWQLLLCFFAGIGFALAALGKIRINGAWGLIIIFMIGGVLFHEIWEASGRYTIRYVLAEIPVAASGICAAVDALDGLREPMNRRRLRRYRNRRTARLSKIGD